MVNSLVPLLHPDNIIQVRTLAFEVIIILVLGRPHLRDLFFNSDKALYLLSLFFKFEHLNCMYRSVYGLLQVIESVKTNEEERGTVARQLFILVECFMNV